MKEWMNGTPPGTIGNIRSPQVALPPPQSESLGQFLPGATCGCTVRLQTERSLVRPPCGSHAILYILFFSRGQPGGFSQHGTMFQSVNKTNLGHSAWSSTPAKLRKCTHGVARGLVGGIRVLSVRGARPLPPGWGLGVDPPGEKRRNLWRASKEPEIGHDGKPTQ